MVLLVHFCLRIKKRVNRTRLRMSQMWRSWGFIHNISVDRRWIWQLVINASVMKTCCLIHLLRRNLSLLFSMFSEAFFFLFQMLTARLGTDVINWAFLDAERLSTKATNRKFLIAKICRNKSYKTKEKINMTNN